MMYPKIQTLFERDENFKVIPDEGHIKLPEVLLIKDWFVTEKIDGTNIRVIYTREDDHCLDIPYSTTSGTVEFRGRTNKCLEAQLNKPLLEHLRETFTVEKMEEVFPDLDPGTVVVLYGEGYGAKINKGGNYCSGVSFRLFDIRIGDWWLEWDDIEENAEKLGIKTVPVLGYWPLEIIIETVRDGFLSYVALEENKSYHRFAEGIVARTVPLLLQRNRHPLLIKLKTEDFEMVKKNGE